MATMVPYSKIDVDSIVVDGPLVTLKDGYGHLARLSLAGGGKLVFQTPLMSIAWAPNVKEQKAGQTSCNLPLSFGSSKPSVKDMEPFLLRIQQKVLDIVHTHSKEWFGSEISRNECGFMFNDVVKVADPSTNYSNLFLPKIKHHQEDDGAFKIDVKVVDTEGHDFSVDDIKKTTKVMACISIPYVHVGKKSISLRCDVSKIIAVPLIEDDALEFDMAQDEELAAILESNRKRKASQISAASSEAVAEAASASASAPGKDRDAGDEERDVMAEFDNEDDV